MKFFAAVSILLFVLCDPATAQNQTERPNIVFIVADDLGYADLSIYGRKDYETPALDRMAEEGMRFSHAYAAAPVCTPSRAGFMTGRYPARIEVGLLEPLTGRVIDRSIGLPASHPTVSSLLKENGYETVLVGKWHLGSLPEYYPRKHGFDEFFGILAGAADYISHVPGLFENDERVEREGHLTDLLTGRAVDFITRPHSRPFFLSLQYTAPHWPWQGPRDIAGVYQDTLPDPVYWALGGSKEKYAEMITHLDRGIGEVLAALDRSGLRETTLVIFTSDNGGERFSDMGELSGRKMDLREGGIRVPAIVQWPGVVPADTETDQVAITMDWTATILAAAQIKPHASYPLDGIDLLPIITGASPVKPRTFAWRTYQRIQQKALRSGDWKYLSDEAGEYLFHVVDDPGEKRDLKAGYPDRLEQLRSAYHEWESQMREPIPLQ